MKSFNSTIPGIMLVCMLLVHAAANSQLLDLPQASQMAGVSQRIGITDINIRYSRPNVAARPIWGALVPYGMNNLGFGTSQESPWRAGANENTVISFSSPVSVEGKSLAAGSYGLHMVIHEDGKATVIFSNNHTSWGSYFYDPSEDALRVEVETKEIPHTEHLTYLFTGVEANLVTASLNWEKKQVPFNISADVTKLVLEDVRKKLRDSPGFSRQTWEQAANFSLNNGGDLEEALKWINGAIEGQFFSQKTFNNLQVKAQLLNKLGRGEEAATLLKESLPLGTVFEVHQYGRQLITQGQPNEALEVFKWNSAAHKNTWPVDYGLARGYSATGDYKKAQKHLKLAAGRAPDQLNKDAIAANLKKLEMGEDIN